MKRLTNFTDILEGTYFDKAIEVGSNIANAWNSKFKAPTPTANTSAAINTTATTNIKSTVGANVASNMKISNHFQLYDFLRSDLAKSLKISEQDKPSDEVIKNIQQFCTTILDPIFDSGVQFTINSGWRSQALNDKLRGSSNTSYHMLGLAADIHPTNMGMYEAFDKINSLNLPLYELLLETGGGGQWIHISYEPTQNKPKKIRRSFTAY